MSAAVAIFAGLGLVFFALAKGHARPGMNALALGLCLAATPLFSHQLPGQDGKRDALAFVLLLVVASIGTGLGGGLKPRVDDHHHPHDH